MDLFLAGVHFDVVAFGLRGRLVAEIRLPCSDGSVPGAFFLRDFPGFDKSLEIFRTSCRMKKRLTVASFGSRFASAALTFSVGNEDGVEEEESENTSRLTAQAASVCCLCARVAPQPSVVARGLRAAVSFTSVDPVSEVSS